MISVEHVTFAYGSNPPVLQGVDIDVAPRTITAILGRNGCGKSTLLRLILGLLTPQQGRISLEGKPLGQYSATELAQRVSFVPQLSHTNLGLTVLDYLCLGRSAYMRFYEMPSLETLDFARACGEKCNVSSLLHRPISQLSGGQRQLVMMAKALVQDSEYILLDEPTSALDLCNQQQVLSLLLELQAMGKTIVFTTHNPNHPLLLDAQIYLLQEGKVLGQGAASQVLTEACLHQLYGVNTLRMANGARYCFDLNLDAPSLNQLPLLQ